MPSRAQRLPVVVDAQLARQRLSEREATRERERCREENEAQCLPVHRALCRRVDHRLVEELDRVAPGELPDGRDERTPRATATNEVDAEQGVDGRHLSLVAIEERLREVDARVARVSHLLVCRWVAGGDVVGLAHDAGDLDRDQRPPRSGAEVAALQLLRRVGAEHQRIARAEAELARGWLVDDSRQRVIGIWSPPLDELTAERRIGGGERDNGPRRVDGVRQDERRGVRPLDLRQGADLLGVCGPDVVHERIRSAADHGDQPLWRGGGPPRARNGRDDDAPDQPTEQDQRKGGTPPAAELGAGAPPDRGHDGILSCAGGGARVVTGIGPGEASTLSPIPAAAPSGGGDGLRVAPAPEQRARGGAGELRAAHDLGAVHNDVVDADRLRVEAPAPAGRSLRQVTGPGSIVASSNTTMSACHPSTSRPRSRRP